MILQLLDGTSYDVADYNLTRLFHYIPSLEVEHDIQSVEGLREIITNTQFKNRTISVEFMFKSYDIYDFYLLRDEINALFTRDDTFYIIFKREPYKRYKVKLASGFSLPPHPRIGKFTVEFITVNRFAESIATTADLKEWDVNKWGWNNTIDWDEGLTYLFNTNNVVVKNLGNVAIDPREHELEIVLKGTFASNVKITNQTTGEIYQYNAALSSTDELRITGVQTFKNDVSDFKNTNKKLLTLAVGNNNILVGGGTVTSVVFKFRFLYK